MVFLRAAAMRSCVRRVNHTAAQPQLFRFLSARRGYATAGSKTSNFGGDALWATGAILVTVPSCWYLLSNRPHQAHHKEHDHVEQHNEDNPDNDTKKSEENANIIASNEREKDNFQSSINDEESHNHDGNKIASPPQVSPETSDDTTEKVANSVPSGDVDSQTEEQDDHSDSVISNSANTGTSC